MATALQRDKDLQKKFETIKVLIVEDEPEIRIIIRDMLADAGIHRVFEAPNGKEALLFLDADFESVDLIICDWNMPSMTGIDFLRQIRTVYPDLPFVMVTGKCDKNSVVEAKLAGVTGFIRKPFSPGQFASKLKVILSNKSQEISLS